MFQERTNYYKVVVLTVATVLGLALAAGLGLGALRGYQSYAYLNTVVGSVDNKPITRANYLDLQLQREAQAKPAAPAEGK